MRASIVVTVDPYDAGNPEDEVIRNHMVVELEGVTLDTLKNALHDMGVNQIWKLVDSAFLKAENVLTEANARIQASLAITPNEEVAALTQAFQTTEPTKPKEEIVNGDSEPIPDEGMLG